MKLTVGIDEVGRGPLAGPVVAAAVILDSCRPISGLKDSKQLSAKKREQIATIIQEKSICYAFGQASAQEIDQLNILQASLLAMKRAVTHLTIQPTFAWVDGKFCPDLSCPVNAFIRGDQYIPVISAASIIAKVKRDQEMMEWDVIYPGYGFYQHKGYPTKLHIEAIRRLGITPIHRLSFSPVKEISRV